MGTISGFIQLNPIFKPLLLLSRLNPTVKNQNKIGLPNWTGSIRLLENKNGQSHLNRMFQTKDKQLDMTPV